MLKHITTITVGAVMLLAMTTGALAFDIDWYTIDGGGAMQTTGGTFKLSGTVGQPDAGQMTGGTYAVIGGFWPVAVSYCLGDIDGDGDTDPQDLTLLLAAWFSRPGDPNWDPRADLDNDLFVGPQDLTLLLSDWFCGM